jgi:hypothetical protein
VGTYLPRSPCCNTLSWHRNAQRYHFRPSYAKPYAKPCANSIQTSSSSLQSLMASSRGFQPFMSIKNVVVNTRNLSNTPWPRLALLSIVAIVTIPYRRTFKLYTWKPLKEMRAARGQRNLLIAIVRQWKEEKYGELGSVQVSASPSLHAEHPVVVMEPQQSLQEKC